LAPVALAKELPVGGDPLSVRLLGEDLVLFRDDNGRLGLLGLQCPHRCTDLSYGRIEDGGLRCIYHGWLFDIEGNCLEQPGEPAGSTFKDKIKHTAYPCKEAAGLIFAYLGSGEPPLLPAYEFLTADLDYVHSGKVYHDCNYLQGNEGNIDPSHLSFLHAFQKPQQADGNKKGFDFAGDRFFGKDTAPLIELEKTNFGIRIHALRDIGEGKSYLRNTYFIMPNLSAFTGPLEDGYTVNWHVPIDDISHWKYMITFTRKSPIDKKLMDAKFFEGEVMEDYFPLRTRENRYLQNRKNMNWNYSGIGETPGCCFPSQDLIATESQGHIQDRSREHLGYTDKAIAAARNMMLQAIEQMQKEEEPPHVVRDASENRFTHLMVVSEVLPQGEDWKTYWQKKEQEMNGTAK
jgi:phthalate 4,5-dioxygenase oxygenase subunit